ncbi:MAG: hypothetical protein RL207_1846 [Bacteroidota bacterium]|jgi:uncharacterized protein YdeI (YjbR/CyaY-like superfamily)
MIQDSRVDAFIEKSADFARPILQEMRSIIQEAHPELEETWKWSFPNYTFNGKIICSFSAFKNHCSFGFWLGAQMSDPHHILEQVGKTAMGSLGKITTVSQLPERELLITYILHAIELSEKGVTVQKKSQAIDKPEQTSLDFPEFFLNAQKEGASFDRLSPSQRKEYVTWIFDSKTSETKNKRTKIMLENLRDGKSLHWKYKK